MKLTKISGFTMIELLIVIAVLGVLAVAVLSAINPIEQINRSYDTGSRSDAEQLISAVDRYYTAKQYYPWQSAADDTANEAAANELLNMKDNANAHVHDITTALGGQTGELKDAFITKISSAAYNALYLHNHGLQGNSTYVCFIPKSKAFSSEAQNRCEAGMPNDLDATVNTTICQPADASDTMSCLP